MDVLRSFHATQTYVDEARTVKSWVRWYPAKPGAKPFPQQHAFGSPVWEPDRGEFEVGPSCLLDGLQYRSKRFAAPNGQHFHGELEWFQSGLPSEVLSNLQAYQRPECIGYEKPLVMKPAVSLEAIISRPPDKEMLIPIGVSLSWSRSFH